MLKAGDILDDKHTYFRDPKNGRPYLNIKEIRQFFAMHGPLVWCWGAENYAKISDSTMRFEVSGLIHQGFVYILLNSGDMFDVYIVGWDGKIKEVFGDVFLDQLVGTIDQAVEQK